MAKPCSKQVFSLNVALETLFRHEHSVQSWFVSVCILRPIRPVTMKKLLLQQHFMEMSEIHRENMFYPNNCTDSSS